MYVCMYVHVDASYYDKDERASQRDSEGCCDCQEDQYGWQLGLLVVGMRSGWMMLGSELGCRTGCKLGCVDGCTEGILNGCVVG